MADMIKAIERPGCVVECLPPYSPDLNPMEHKGTQAKSARRKTQCSVDEWFQDYANL